MSDAACQIMKSARIVCFGDSVTLGVPHVAPEDTFPAVLQRRLNMRYSPSPQVCAINSGIGGENTLEGLARIEDDVLAHQPTLVTVEFGLNDIRYEPDKRVSEEQFAQNLREMHRRIQDAGAAVVFMTANPIINLYHVYSQGTRYYDQWGGCDGLNAVYAGIVRQVAHELGAPLCDIYSAFVKEAVEAEFRGETFDYRDLSILSRLVSSRDGVHPTTAGQQKIAAELYGIIVQNELLATHL